MSEMLIFDLGYNMGNFTKQALSLYPNAKIIGVDGHPEYQRLFNLTPIPNVTYIQGLISDECTDGIPFYICDSNPGINSINPEWIKTIRHSHFFDKTKRMTIEKSMTIDRLIAMYGVPDIIKMDIEGAESIALRGLTQKCGLITFEWSEEFFHDALKCVDRLKQLGYSLFAYTEENDQFIPNIFFMSWEILDMTKDIIPDRKRRWGMIYAK
jgi:FkbM family methyltransferase